MKPMTREELAEITTALGRAVAATPAAVTGAAKAAALADWHRANPVVAEQWYRRATRAVPSLVRRLLDAEESYAAVRSTVARLVVANNRGDDYSLSDLASELEQAGIDLKDDYDEADDLARATEQEPIL